MKQGSLFVISGPSGAGKGTIVKRLLKKAPQVALSISCTTRAPRPGEVHGKHYYFISHEEFERMIERGDFLEYARVFDNYYGTPKPMVQAQRTAGKDVLLEIDVQGALQVKERAPDAVLIFIAPPDLQELQRRLVGRNTETPEQVKKRLAGAEAEMRLQSRYDHVVVNDTVENAVARVIEIMSRNE